MFHEKYEELFLSFINFQFSDTKEQMIEASSNIVILCKESYRGNKSKIKDT